MIRSWMRAAGDVIAIGVTMTLAPLVLLGAACAVVIAVTLAPIDVPDPYAEEERRS